MANIIVYGSGWAGIAAAAKAAKNAPNATVHLISPYPEAKLGGISTIGGQNYVDLRRWSDSANTYGGEDGEIVQRGSFFDWYNHLGWDKETGAYYNTEIMAAYLRQYATCGKPNVVIHDCYDITGYSYAHAPYRIIGVHLRRITKDINGRVVWTNGTKFLTCDILIDASDDAKITRTACPNVITGRFDWSADLLDSDEHTNGVAKQQAATLMFKMTDIVYDAAGATSKETGYVLDGGDSADSGETPGEENDKKVMMAWGGKATYAGIYPVSSGYNIPRFNEEFQNAGYMLKPFNVARDGSNSNEFWVNAFLVFNVDGRRHNRDDSTGFNPTTTIPGTKSTDDAYVDAVNFLNQNSAKVLAALRSFPGFCCANFVRKNGKIVVGDTLYIRETVHTTSSKCGLTHNTENVDFHLTQNECHNAGSGTNGADLQNYPTRIGLGYYNSDLHPYSPSDLMNASGRYVWGYLAYRVLRPGLDFGNNNAPQHPVYVPYEVLVTETVANLLVPGYAANMSSFSWGEMRVFPNQAVLGDAAGVAAAYCVNNCACPNTLNSNDIAVIQNMLRAEGARLDK